MEAGLTSPSLRRRPHLDEHEVLKSWRMMMISGGLMDPLEALVRDEIWPEKSNIPGLKRERRLRVQR